MSVVVFKAGPNIDPVVFVIQYDVTLDLTYTLDCTFVSRLKNTVHHPICGFFISQKSVHKSGFVHKSGESPQIESVGDFIHTTERVHYNTGLFSDRVVLLRSFRHFLRFFMSLVL